MIGFYKIRRRASTLIECVMALTVLGAAMMLAVEGLSLLAAQRRTSDRRQAALVELDQVLERVAVAPWDELTSENIGAWKLSERFRAPADDACVIAEVADEAGPPAAKRLSVSLHWTASGVDETSPPLVFWRYKLPEATP
jgi:hypothetical protein